MEKLRTHLLFETQPHKGWPSLSLVNSLLFGQSDSDLHHQFFGWGTQPSGGVSYAPGATYNFASSLNLFAQWSLGEAPVVTLSPVSAASGSSATFSASDG